MRWTCHCASYPPECFRIPPLEDSPSNFLPARRVMALLKGAESNQPHWLERRPEAHGRTGGRDVVCVRVLKDAEFRRRTAMRSGDLLGTAVQFCTTASLHYNSGSMGLARAFFGKALAAFEASGDVRGVAFCHNLLGTCHYRLHQFKVTLLHHKQHESVGGCFARAVAQINMAICYAALSWCCTGRCVEKYLRLRGQPAGHNYTGWLGGLPRLRTGDMCFAQTNLK
ncbi:unnamed protein product [Trypanosoma congolense IL3000]|uniref:WGS project CAEQ00000000 data, annotated contig 9 n=1 Tax=Trypanosoma congolense (strain IL3000) TaxID=1068625 RepID=F9WJT3_TRYCI|nr:unnamed protein product [Trypanosoma congolense IL3000]